MGRCSNDIFRKVSVKNINTEDYEIELSVLTNLPECKKVNTKFLTSSVEDSLSYYNSNLIPENKYECYRQGCINGGTEMFKIVGGKTKCGAIYKAAYDAIEWSLGVITMYVYAEAYPVNVLVDICDDDTFTNKDTYTITLNEKDFDEKHFAPVTIDLVDAAGATGTGWAPSTKGAYIKISADKDFGLSTISIFDSIEDFDVNNVVKLGCVDKIDGTIDVPVIDKVCGNSQYDSSSVKGFERTFTVHIATPNFWMLNPLLSKSDDFMGSTPVTIAKTATLEGNYAVIEVPDARNEVCTFYSAQIEGGCNVLDDTLQLISIPTLVDIDNFHFQVIKQDNGVKFYFNKEFADRSILISYPQSCEIVRREAKKSNIGETRCIARYTKTMSDDEKYIITLRNVLITSFPEGFDNSSDNQMEVKVSIQPDSDGVYYTEDRIVL